MSKLRADITWSHRANSNSSAPTPLSIITDVENQKNNGENPNENPNNENPDENPDNILENKEDEEEEESTNLEKEFGDYLQGWSEMLEEETLKFQNDENDTFEELNEVTVDDIIHPAIDPNAKWNLDSLFKELELSF